MINDFVSQVKYIPRALIIGFLLLVVFMFYEENRETWKYKLKVVLKRVWLVSFELYVAFVITSTLIGRQYTVPYKNILGGFIFFSDASWYPDIIENIVLYVPYTFFYLKAFQPKYCWKTSLLLSFFTSTIVELLQLLLWLGEFQLSDILHNTIGGMIGCGIWYLVKVAKEKHQAENK